MKLHPCRLLAAAAVASATAAAPAAPLVDGLSINVARTTFELNAPSGGATQGGVEFGTFGGVANSRDSGLFTQTGDRIGASLAAFGSFGASPLGATAGLFGHDYGITLANSTATDIEVVLQALVSNRVVANGPDAYAKSSFIVRRGSTELFFSDFRTDTVNTGPGNNLQQASPDNLLTLVILANSSLQLLASQDLEGGAFVDGSSFDASLDAALRVESSRLLGGVVDPGTGNTVPVPGTLALLLAALPALAWARRREPGRSLSLFPAAALLGALAASPAQACSGSEPYLATVCVTAATFCPRGYLPADGRVLSIRDSTALFALIGTTYGGNGITTFHLPDLRGRAPISQGQAPGLSPVVLGQAAGVETVSLNVDQLPAHTHNATVALQAATSNGTTDNPAGAVPARLARSNLYSSAAPDAAMATNTVTVATTGRGQPLPIRNPVLGLQFCVAVQGIFPTRD